MRVRHIRRLQLVRNPPPINRLHHGRRLTPKALRRKKPPEVKNSPVNSRLSCDSMRRPARLTRKRFGNTLESTAPEVVVGVCGKGGNICLEPY